MSQGSTEWCFVVASASGLGEIRIRSNGEVVFTHGSSEWVVMDGICFPTQDAKVQRFVRNDVIRLNSLAADGAEFTSDRLLYHYTRAETALDYILKNQSLRLSPFSGTNDPREAKEWAFTVVAEEGKAPPGETIKVSGELSALLRERARLTCFCNDGHPATTAAVPAAEGQGWKHARMWAQYASGHAGVVLVFNRRQLLRNAVDALGTQGTLLFGNVLYADHNHPGDLLPLLVNYDAWVATAHADYARRHLETYADWLFFTKHIDWAQEHEARIAFFANVAGDFFIPTKSALVEICVGDLISKDHLAAVRAVAKAIGCEVTQASWRNGMPIRHPAR
jgi:hypothetical protein